MTELSRAVGAGAVLAAPAQPEWRRLSPRMLLVHPVIELLRAVPALLGLLLAGNSSGAGSRWGLIGTAVVIALSLTRWFTTSYRITPEQIQLRTGLLRRRTISAPMDRVRTVDVTAHLLHRVLGLARVVVGTGISDRKAHQGIALDGLTAAAAQGLREELLHRRAPGLAWIGEQYLARLDPSWLRYAPFTLSGTLTGLALLGFGWRVITEGQVNLRGFEPLRSLGEAADRSSATVDVAAVVLAVALFVTVASTAGYLLAFWNFRLSRHPGGSIHVQRGLITTRATSIERSRLLGVELTEPLLLRAVGGAGATVIATGLRVGRGAEHGGEVLLPPAPARIAIEVASAVLGDAVPMTAALRVHGPMARRRRYVRAVGVSLLAVAGAGLTWWAGGLAGYGWLGSLVGVPCAAALAADRYRALGHDLVHGYLVTRAGSLVRRRSALAIDAIIGWNLRSTCFQRRLGLSTVTATTAGGRQHYRCLDLPAADALQLIEAATPGLVSQFRSPTAPEAGS
jgi:putative membrane protein